MLNSPSYFDDIDSLYAEEDDLPAIPQFPTIFRQSNKDEEKRTTPQE